MIFKKIISGLASDKNSGNEKRFWRSLSQANKSLFTILGIYTKRTLHLAPGNLYYIVVDT